MGEYFTVIDKTRESGYRCICKAGTCDDWRYVRRSEVLKQKTFDAGRQTNIAVVLNEPGIIYRFPWVEEDNQETWEKVNERDMFKTHIFQCDIAKEIEHEDITVSVHPKTSKYGYNVNVQIACPIISKDRKSPTPNIIDIYGVRYDEEGNERTLFRCGYCGKPFCVDKGEIERLRESFRSRRAKEQQKWADNTASRFKAVN